MPVWRLDASRDRTSSPPISTPHGRAVCAAPRAGRLAADGQVGRLGYNLTGIGGFAQAFLHAGAGPFVGGRCVIRQRATFTKVFHDALREGQERRRARAKARADGDATWVACVVYSHPEAKLTLG